MSANLKTLETIARNAENLYIDGYRVCEGYMPNIFLVTSPVKDQPGGSRGSRCYRVNAVEGTCTCPGFRAMLSCKHLLRVQMDLQEEALVAEFEAREAEAETSTGCDQYSEF